MVKVSVITPFYNGSRYIQKCVQSIQSQIFGDFEHIIVNDGSSKDELIALQNIVENIPRVRIISKENGKQASAANEGIKNCDGEYIAFCDQDDWWLPTKLEKQVEFLEKNQNVDLVYSDAFLGDDFGNTLNTTWMMSRGVLGCDGGYRQCIKSLFQRNFVCAPLVMLVRKIVFSRVGYMNEKFSTAYDYDFLFRCFESGCEVGFIKEPLAVWRVHASQESNNIRRAKKMQARILFAFLSRNPIFVLTHFLLILIKMVRIGIAFFTNFNPYKVSR